jgi:hypothetical protein
MKTAGMTTLKASLIASVVGTGAWITGAAAAISPSHPNWAVFWITLGTTAILMYTLPQSDTRR